MIYDPSRRAQELRHRILESMTAEEIEAYDRQTRRSVDSISKIGQALREIAPEAPSPD